MLNEQYMLCSHTTTPTQKSIEDGPTNKIIKILCYHGTDYRTFGENIVLLINRESAPSPAPLPPPKASTNNPQAKPLCNS